jgi:hypothetical protein
MPLPFVLDLTTVAGCRRVLWEPPSVALKEILTISALR